MRVLMIGSNLRVPGGITRVVKNYFQAGIGEKLNLEYFPTYWGSNNAVNAAYFTIQYLKLFSKLFIKKETFDVSHVHMSYKGSFLRKKYIIKLLELKGIPIILHMHGSQFKKFFDSSTARQQRKIQNVLNSVDIIIALGEEWRDYYASISCTEVISLENAVFPKAIEDAESEKIYITSMGLLSERKGTYDLIDASAGLKNKIDEKYKIVLAGNGEIQKVKNHIDSLGLQESFIVPGWISDQAAIEEFYRKSIVYVLPSYHEGMPMSILEAMSYGLPIISTKVGSIPSIVLDDQNGYLIEPGNPEEIERKIIHLINNQEKREQMKAVNIKKIEEHFNIHNNLKDLVAIYKKAGNARPMNRHFQKNIH